MDEERLKLTPVVCGACGFVAADESARQREARQSRHFRHGLIGASIVFVVSFLQVAAWGSFAVEMPLLKLKDTVGLATLGNLERMAVICQQLKKYDCLEHAYARQAKLDARRTVRLAEYQMLRHKFGDAAQTLAAHLRTAKNDLAAMDTYARVLGEMGRTDESIQVYQRAMTVQPRTLNADLVKNYVKTLARARRYTQAQAVILEARRKHARAGFMEQELRIITELNSSTGRAIASTAKK